MEKSNNMQIASVLSSLPDIENKYKIIIIGDGGTGKSSYVERLNNGDFKFEYNATMGIVCHNIVYSTSHSIFNILMCDTSGQEKLGPLRDTYYENVDAAILFFDVTSRITYKNIPNWYRDIIRVCPDIPIVLCANKVDVVPRKVSNKHINYHNKFNIGYFEISVKEKVNLREPMQYLLQKLTKQPSLTLVDSIGTSEFDDLSKLSLKSVI